MKKGLIIFDFDGVLADSFDTFYSLIRDSMTKVGLSLTPDQYRDLFIGNVHKGFRDLIKNENKYSTFLEFRNSNYDKYYYNERHKAKLFPKAIKFLKEISKNYILTVASSGRENNVINLLGQNKARDLFALIIANSSKNKTGMIENILNKFNALPKKTTMISDTVGDILTAKKLGLKTIAVTWGFHSEKMLKSANPDFMAKSFKEIQKILNQQ